jgi:hypothetical protein
MAQVPHNEEERLHMHRAKMAAKAGIRQAHYLLFRQHRDKPSRSTVTALLRAGFSPASIHADLTPAHLANRRKKPHPPKIKKRK